MLATSFGLYLERSAQGVNSGTNHYMPTLGLFTHYAGTYDGAVLRMFVDGAEYGTAEPDARPTDRPARSR